MHLVPLSPRPSSPPDLDLPAILAALEILHVQIGRYPTQSHRASERYQDAAVAIAAAMDDISAGMRREADEADIAAWGGV
jgi:hypothetical protein